MAINKVIYGNDTLIDLTDSTVNPTNLLAGEKAYGADGEPVFGTLELGSTINITAIDSEFFGEDVTLSDGVTTLITAFDNQGEATFLSVILTGLLIITCKGLSQTISVQTYGTYNVTFDPVPEGATITPVNSIPIWLRCAHIADKNYTTLAEVLADRETFDILLRDSNACDYMARSTEWAGDSTVKAPTMTSNTTPSGECSASSNFNHANYQTWKAFDNNTSTQWLTTTVNASTVSYIQYKFSEARIVNTVKMIFENWASGSMATVSNISIKGSNDGSNFTLLHSYQPDNDKNQLAIFDNNDSYSYYRVEITGYNAINTQAGVLSNVSIAELQFYQTGITTSQDSMALLAKYDYARNALLGNEIWSEAIANSDYWDSVLQPLVPTMTSNNTPEGTCIYSSEQSSYKAYYAFDSNNSTQWMNNSSGVYASNIYIGYTFTKKVLVNKYYIIFDQAVNCTYILQGSNDGTNWVDIGSTSTLLSGYVQVPNTIAYLSYRIYIISAQYPNQYYGHGRVVTLQFYGITSSEVLVPLVPKMTSDTQPSGECFSSYDNSNAYLVFDGNDSTTFMGSASTAIQSFGYDFGEPVYVNKATHLSQSGYGATNPKIKIQYSDDKSTWQDASEPVSFGASANILTTIIGNINTPHRYWRVYLYGDGGVSSWNTYTVQFYQRTVQTSIIHSCANDTIYYLDENEEPVVIATTNSDGDGICDFSLLEDKIYRLYSTVAKDLNNLSNPYSKRVRITKSEFGGTTELYSMPDAVKTLYWFGYENGIEDAISANGWTASASYGVSWVLISPTWNMNNVSHTSSSNSAHISGVVTKTKYNLSNYNSIKLLVDSSAHGIYLRTYATSNDFVNGGNINVGVSIVVATDVQHTEDISSLTAESYIGVQLGRQTGVGALKYLFLE